MTRESDCFARITILGAGALGTLLGKSLQTSRRVVHLYDLRPRDGVHVADATHPTTALAAELAQADLVILALPHEAIETALPAIAACVSSNTLIVETSSVKSSIATALTGVPAGIELIGINPMFAPSLGFAGQNVAVIRHRPGAQASAFEKQMSEWGASLVYLDAEHHDRLAAVGQNAVHFALLTFGMTLSRAGVDIPTLMRAATPPLRAMLLLLSRILRQNAAIYWDIQTANPYAASARTSFLESGAELDDIITSAHGQETFQTALSLLAQHLSAALPTTSAASDQMLSAIPPNDFAAR